MRIISGTARGRQLAVPAGLTTRPALDRQRESIFGILRQRVEGSRVLDLFAGVGAFGLEALSRGARHATFVESSAVALESLEKNLDHLEFRRQATVIRGDALSAPSQEVSEPGFDLVFVDPPFEWFDEAASVGRLFARVDEIVRSPLTHEGAVLVLRIPSKYPGDVPLPDHDRRVYGQSAVLFVDRPESPSAP